MLSDEEKRLLGGLFTPDTTDDEAVIRAAARESRVRDQDLRDMETKFIRLLDWWARMSDKYPYQVEIPLSLVRDENLPEILNDYGPQIMAHLRPSWRTYGFMHKRDADKFIRRYPQRAKHFQWGQGSGLVI